MGETEIYLLLFFSIFTATTSPSTRQPSLPVTVTITSFVRPFLIFKLSGESDIDSDAHSTGVAVGAGVGEITIVGVGIGGRDGRGGRVGREVTVGIGDGVGNCVAVGKGPGVVSGVGETTGDGVGEIAGVGAGDASGVGVGDAAGVGVTGISFSVVKLQLYADSIVVPAQFAAATLVVTVPVYCVPYRRLNDGVKVIVAPFVTT